MQTEKFYQARNVFEEKEKIAQFIQMLEGATFFHESLYKDAIRLLGEKDILPEVQKAVLGKLKQRHEELTAQFESL